jgi:hypothetical protein
MATIQHFFLAIKGIGSNTTCLVAEIHGYDSAASNRRLFQAGFFQLLSSIFEKNIGI